MLRFGLTTLVLLAALLPTRFAAARPASSCSDAAAAAERDWTLPPDLINAIGRVESGRPDPATGRLAPWPWTVNADGASHYLASLAEAVSFVRTLQSRGVRLIDVGCFQVDLFYHPTAFATLEQAFDPGANADYAARFLTALHQRSGNWPTAVAGYHSALALEGENYRKKVMNQWTSAEVVAGTINPPAAGSVLPRPPARDPFVVLMSATARAIRVIGPSTSRGFRLASLGQEQ